MNPIERWHQTWALLDVAPPEGLIERLLSAYGESHRAYHTVDHLVECFAHLDSSPLQPANPASVELALWFHDAIYDTKAADSEARSAEWAREALGVLGTSVTDQVAELILVTKHSALPENPDQALLLDVDLAILGAPTERFQEYEVQVRCEYSWVPEEAYRKARAQILSQFQERALLYNTEHFRAQLEEQARVNLQGSLDMLAV